MKIYISVDMEGVSGITHPAQCRPQHSEFRRFRDLFTNEVNAAIEGALAGGATEVLVNDAHFTMTNIVLENLHPRAELISGSTKVHGQMEGLDSSFDGVFFVGYHQGDGLGDGAINHTLMSATLRRVIVDGVECDEAMINARFAGAHGVPVILLTGDDVTCAAAEANFKGIEVAAVKSAVDRLTSRSLHPQVAHERIRSQAQLAVENLKASPPEPLIPSGPNRFELEFRSTSSAHCCTVFPGVERLNPTSIAFEQDDFIAAFRFFWGLSIFGMAASEGIFGSQV